MHLLSGSRPGQLGPQLLNQALWTTAGCRHRATIILGGRGQVYTGPAFRISSSPPALVAKASAGDAADSDLILGSGRSPRDGNSNPLQYACLENSMDRRVWRASVHGVSKCQTQLSDWAHTSPSGSSPVQARSQNTLGHLPPGQSPLLFRTASPLTSSQAPAPSLGPVHKMSLTGTHALHKVIPPEQVLFQTVSTGCSLKFQNLH